MAVSVVIDVPGESFLRGGAQVHGILRRSRLRRRRRRLFGGLRTDELWWLAAADAVDHGM